jgi:hypothetical protein
MNSRKLLEKNPLSANVIKEWFLNKLLESIKRDDTVPQDFKDYVLAEGITDEKVAIFIDSSPRGLFDLFDEYNIVIETLLYPNGEFTIKIGNEATTNSWKTRKEAEIFGIEAAFELLEQQLKEKENGEIISGTDSSDN